MVVGRGKPLLISVYTFIRARNDGKSLMPHHTTISTQISMKIWICIACSFIVRYCDFYLDCSSTGVGIKHGFKWFELRLVPFPRSLASPHLLGASLNYNYKPHFKKPLKTMFDTNSGRVVMKIKIAAPSNQATGYLSLNIYTDLAWYGGVVGLTVTDFRAHFHEHKKWWENSDGLPCHTIRSSRISIRI